MCKAVSYIRLPKKTAKLQKFIALVLELFWCTEGMDIPSVFSIHPLLLEGQKNYHSDDKIYKTVYEYKVGSIFGWQGCHK